tara:strand:- start:423 stop:1844 length:1422 start_codon:yes stop_codon:yes gene_type:complete
MAGPIVLGSNLTGNYGALPGDADYYVAPTQGPMEGMVENDDGTYTMPTYTRELYDTSGIDWSMYGTKYAPMVRYFKTVQGEDYVYDPKDDMISEEDANTLASDFENEFGMDAKEILKQEAIGYAKSLVTGVGAQAGRAVAAAVNPTLGYQSGDFTKGLKTLQSEFGVMDTFRAPKTGAGSKIMDSGSSQNAIINSFEGNPTAQKAFKASFKDGNKDAIANYKMGLNEKIGTYTNAQGEMKPNLSAKEEQDYLGFKKMDADADAALDNFELAAAGPGSGYFGGFMDRGDIGLFDGKMSEAGRSNLYGSAGAGLAVVATSLASGENLGKSVETAAKYSVGNFFGNMLLPGWGGPILGSILSRVICNELMRQGLLTRKQVALDYKFTKDHLTPQHVAGYHVWAVWMVKQMRKGRLVNFWTHVAGHRANEIAYIYGERDKPDYLGKVYRKVLEPICWSIGFFCKKTDWSVLYKQKEI